MSVNRTILCDGCGKWLEPANDTTPKTLPSWSELTVGKKGSTLYCDRESLDLCDDCTLLLKEWLAKLKLTKKEG